MWWVPSRSAEVNAHTITSSISTSTFPHTTITTTCTSPLITMTTEVLGH